MHLWHLPILITAFFCINSCTASSIKNNITPQIIGEYSSVSESEWHQILTLNQNGTAVLRTISWYPGDPESEKEERQVFQWSYKTPYLELISENNKIILKYREEINLEKHFHFKGLDGNHPGLSPISPLDERKIIYSTLWREPRTFVKEMYEKALQD